MAAVDENTPKVRHKRKLEEINGSREKHDTGLLDGGYPPPAGREVQPVYRGDQGLDLAVAGSAQGDQRVDRDSERRDLGIRSINESGQWTAEGDGQSGEPAGTPPLDLTPEQKIERQRELDRQRKQRQRDRERAERDTNRNVFDEFYPEDLSSKSGRDRDNPVTQTMDELKRGTSRFSLKMPGTSRDGSLDNVKTFSKTEAEESLVRLAEVYQRGYGLLDDMLEVIVRGHEPVSIWQLDDFEAETLAKIHLESAKTDKKSAQAARTLLALHGKIMVFTIHISRLKATGSHVVAHGGFSFR